MYLVLFDFYCPSKCGSYFCLYITLCVLQKRYVLYCHSSILLNFDSGSDIKQVVDLQTDSKVREYLYSAICMPLVSENLQRYFSRYGDVIDCVVMKNSESGRSRGFGFVTFSDPANVSLVLQSGPHQLDGRTVRKFFFSIKMNCNVYEFS